MAYKIINKKISNEIEFETEAKAKKYFKQLQSIRDKYSTITYYREGKKVYRY